MLPINHLKKTLDRELGPDRWEFNNNPVGDFFIVHAIGTGHIYKVQLISDAWTSCLWDGKQWVADGFLSSRLNGLKRDEAGAPVMETPDKESTR